MRRRIRRGGMPSMIIVLKSVSKVVGKIWERTEREREREREREGSGGKFGEEVVVEGQSVS